jgi:hypothetical protein
MVSKKVAQVVLVKLLPTLESKGLGVVREVSVAKTMSLVDDA